MDTRRRRLLRQKYLQEEERLGKMRRGLSYDDDEDSDNYALDDNEDRVNRPASYIPKYKARTFRNILRDFDDPDFDESQIYGQEYHREEIDPLEQPKPRAQRGQKKAAESNRSIRTTAAEEKFEKNNDPEVQEFLATDLMGQDEAEELEEAVEVEETEIELDEENYFDYLVPDANEAEDEDDEAIEAPLPSDYQPQPIRRKKTLRQMESGNRRRQANRSKTRNSSVNASPYDGLQKSRVPRPVHVLAFVAFIMLAFLGGYYFCGGMMELMNIHPSSDSPIEQQMGGVPSLGQNREDSAKRVTPSETTSTLQKGGKLKTCTIFVPKGRALSSISIEQKVASSNEQMLKDILNVYLDSVKEIGLISTNTELAELWIAGDTMYLSMNQNFVSDLHKLNATNATLLMRGFLRTINANMPGVKKLKIFTNSQEITDTKPIDLTRTWETM